MIAGSSSLILNMKKALDKRHRVLVQVYDEHALTERMRQKWFEWFKSGNFGLEDEERLERPK